MESSFPLSPLKEKIAKQVLFLAESLFSMYTGFEHICWCGLLATGLQGRLQLLYSYVVCFMCSVWSSKMQLKVISRRGDSISK